MTTNVFDATFALGFVGGLVYVMYRVWTPVWKFLTLTLKLAAFTAIAGALLLYFWPEGLANGYGIGTLIAHFRESRALRVVYALLLDMVGGLSEVDWERLRREWTGNTTRGEL